MTVEYLIYILAFITEYIKINIFINLLLFNILFSDANQKEIKIKFKV